ncbi:MAG: hypothetical protein MJ252_16655, partial [archaeon]|nr:hypothetical protein [archaeon]
MSTQPHSPNKDISKELQLKLKVVSSALIEERKKTANLEKQISDLRIQMAEMEKILNEKEEGIIALTKENLEIQNAMSLKKNVDKEEAEKRVSNIIGKVFQKNTVDPVNDLKIKKLTEENTQLLEQKEKIESEFQKFKTETEEKMKEKEKIISKLNEDKKNYISEICSKNKILSENEQRMEIMSKSLTDFDVQKAKLNTQIKEITTERDELSSDLKETQRILKEKSKIFEEQKEKLKSISEDNLLLSSKVSQYKYNMLQNSTQTNCRFKLEKIIPQGVNIKCFVIFGQTEDNEYMMIYREEEFVINYDLEK